MKRTEKVEIRVSREEKQALAHLAKQEGESLSGLLRGLVEKYMALNAASTKRRLPKWKIAVGLVFAALIGHGLTLIPMHIHNQGHQRAEVSSPTYMVHGAIDNAAFGIGVSESQPTQQVNLRDRDGTRMIIELSFKSTSDGTGILNVTVCEAISGDSCMTSFGGEMDIDRIAPSVLGNNTKSGKPIHIFVQEMAKV